MDMKSSNFGAQRGRSRGAVARRALVALVLLTCASISAEVPSAEGATANATQRRNPFWPVGYTPKAVVTQKVEAVAAPVLSKEELWLRSPVGDEEWEAAREAIPRPSGMFIGTNHETRERIDKMVLMGRTFVLGQKFTTTNNAVAFTWQVDYISIKDKDYRLTRVLAERVPGGHAERH